MRLISERQLNEKNGVLCNLPKRKCGAMFKKKNVTRTRRTKYHP